MSKSFEALEKAIQDQMNKAFKEAVEDSYDDLKKNVAHFYDAPQGTYKRTGQLKASPQLDAINFNGDTAVAQISINTSTQYWPAGRDTATIYGYAESGGLLGYGGFWKQTELDIENNINKSFGKYFSK